MKHFQFSKIKEFREAGGMSQHALGELMGIHPQQISAWERGKGRGMVVGSLGMLAAVLGKKTDDFFTDGEAK